MARGGTHLPGPVLAPGQTTALDQSPEQFLLMKRAEAQAALPPVPPRSGGGLGQLLVFGFVFGAGFTLIARILG